MKTYLIGYAVTAIAFLGVDLIWLSRVATTFYKSRLGDLLAAQPNLAAGGLFYLIYLFGLVHFAVVPALASGSWASALLAGGLLGLVAYGTYDLTNLATLKDWPASLSMVDLAWGTGLSAFAATIGYLGVRWLS